MPDTENHPHQPTPILSEGGAVIASQCALCLEIVVNCPQCSVWHRRRSEYCSPKCQSKGAKQRKRGEGVLR